MKRSVLKIFVYFLCISFLNSITFFRNHYLEAREIDFPVGEIVSKGDVKFESKERGWRNIESPHFPIFQKGKIKTEKGTGIINLVNNCQVEMAQNSTLSIDQVNQLHLFQGRINFRIPSGAEVILRVGNLIITKSRILQASKSSTMGSPKSEETIGSLSLHPNGSVTVKSLQGSLSVLNQDRSVLAAIYPRDSITIPSVMASDKASDRSKTMVAQAGEIKEVRGEPKATGEKEWEYLGLDALEWIAVGYATLLLGWIISDYWPRKEKERGVAQIPLCP